MITTPNRMMWNIPSCTITGTHHQESNVDGQDYVKVTIDSNNTAIVVVTDGVGSASYAYEGSRGLAKEVSHQIMQRGSDILGWSDTDIRVWLQNVVAHWLGLKSKELQCTAKDLDSTLMFFVSNGEKYIAGSIGDGLIGTISPTEYVVLLEPEKGEYANSSFYIATSDFNNHFRITRGAFDQSNVYFLMTDGSCECLYDYHNKTYAEALDVFCQWTLKYSRKAVSKAMLDIINRLFREITSDDCAIAMIARTNKKFL